MLRKKQHRWNPKMSSLRTFCIFVLLIVNNILKARSWVNKRYYFCSSHFAMNVRLKDRRRSLDDPLKGIVSELQPDATQDLHTSVKKAGRYGVGSKKKNRYIYRGIKQNMSWQCCGVLLRVNMRVYRHLCAYTVAMTTNMSTRLVSSI